MYNFENCLIQMENQHILVDNTIYSVVLLLAYSS